MYAFEMIDTENAIKDSIFYIRDELTGFFSKLHMKIECDFYCLFALSLK